MQLLERFTFGVGDRFAHQASAQLAAFQRLHTDGITVVPVWNKSNREHNFIGSEPPSVREAAARAIAAAGWNHGWYVDADHIQLKTVDRFLSSANFFTIDVADSIGHASEPSELTAFVERHPELVGTLSIVGITTPITISVNDVQTTAQKYLRAVREAGAIYRHIAAKKGDTPFVVEVSMDETDSPQTPRELLVILAALADEQIPIQTIAPKFTGRFNKGVDYVGDLTQFQREFESDLAVIRHAIGQYGLPQSLKLSVHSGSDKFSLYPIIRRALQTTGAGIHLKTAGTTWLEELIGLAEAGGDGLALTHEIYEYALSHIDELCAPYASVIDIDRSRLPSIAEVRRWSGPHFASVLRHVPTHPHFNANVRQLLHVSFKVAAKAGTRFTELLKANHAIIAQQVTTNIYDRHMRPLFVD
jgi:tagaturonate epimerase